MCVCWCVTEEGGGGKENGAKGVLSEFQDGITSIITNYFPFFLTNEKRPSPSHTTNLAFIDFIHERKNFPISEKKRENISFENQFKIEKKN